MKKISLIILLLFVGCNSLVTKFEDIEPAIEYSASSINATAESTKSEISVMTWNIRFGAGRIDWFGDHCGDRILLTESEVLGYLNQIVENIDSLDIDILLLQEIDVDSKRSAYKDEVQYLLDETHLNYGVFASMWQAQVIPSHGLGRVNTGNAILSRWKLSDSERIQLDLMTDQDPLEQYFYLRRNIIKAKINIPDKDSFYAVNTHLTAFATDDTKKKHVEKYISTLDEINNLGFYFVSGGDLNSLPPINGEESVPDFCISDACSDETFHNENDGGPHKSGSYFEYDESENTWLQTLYDNYTSGIPLEDVYADTTHFTHSPGTSLDLDRKLDYLFTNMSKTADPGTTIQDYKYISDHVPVMMWININNEVLE